MDTNSVSFTSMESKLEFVKQQISKGGPDPSEYNIFKSWLNGIMDGLDKSEISEDELNTIRKAFGKAISAETLQGFAYTKPHNYPGDFEIIDKIYQEHITSVSELKRWDMFFQAQTAPKAVRNRKTYFKKLLTLLEAQSSEKGNTDVLNVASGPCRDLSEFFQNGNGEIYFDCIDSDQNAIDYAKRLCSGFEDQIEFFKANVFKFRTDKRYRLIWSAGLFDYFEDKAFIFLLKKLISFLEEDGELVIGNFSDENETRAYMEIIGDWNLHYRSESHLIHLTKQCGIPEDQVRIGKEPESVNLFLHINKTKNFLMSFD